MKSTIALHLGLAGRIVAGADLLVLLAPARREVAVEVEPFEVGVDLDRQAVVVPDQRPRASAGSTRRRTRPARARPSGAGPSRALLPRAVRIGDAHVEDAAVAVDVLGGEAVDRLLVERVAPRRRADVARPVGERRARRRRGSGAGRGRPRACRAARVISASLPCLVSSSCRKYRHRGRRGQLGGVDVAVDPERRLVVGGAGRRVRERRDPDVAPSWLLPIERIADQRRERLRVLEQQLRQLVVLVEGVETGRRCGCVGGMSLPKSALEC